MSGTLILPWPPSLNHYYRHVGAKVLISAEGRRYRNAVALAAMTSGWQRDHGTIVDRLAVTIRAYVPDRRRRDVDNLLKSVLDALTHARVWADDSQIDVLTIERREMVDGGSIAVVIATACAGAA